MANDEWLTPREVILALGGAASFDLDPCAPAAQPWPTARFTFTKDDNGLLKRWDGRVWLNPPYSRPWISRFLARMSAHNFGTALIPASTETKHFHEHVWSRASAALFLEGRLPFCKPDGSVDLRAGGAIKRADHPSVLCAYGPQDADVLAFCGLRGKFVPLILPRAFVVKAVEPTWREALWDFFQKNPGPVSLDTLYRAFQNTDKAKRNSNFDAKLRQLLQAGPYRRVSRGMWEAVSEQRDILQRA